MKTSLQAKFLIPTLLLIVGGMVALTVITQISAQGALRESTESEMEQLSATAARELESFVHDKKNAIVTWSDRAVFRDLYRNTEDPAAVRDIANAELAELSARYPEYETLIFADTQGDTLASNNPADVGTVNVQSRAYFPRAMAGETVVSEVLLSRSSGNPTYVVASPMVVDGSTAGIFLGAVSLDGFATRFIDPITIGTRGYAYVVDADGTVIPHPDRSLILEEEIGQYDWGRELVAQQNGLMEYEWRGVDKLASFRSEPETGWIVAISAEPDDIFASINQLRRLSIIVTGVSVLVVAAILFFIVRAIIRSIKDVISHADRMSQGEFDRQLEIARTDEIGTLVAALNTMTDRVREVIEQVQISSKNVSTGSEQMSIATEEIANGSEDLSSAAQRLSEGANEQASSVEEVSSSMEEMAANIKQNADNAMATEKIAEKAAEDANHGGEAVGLTVSAMKQIAEKISIIEDIARETNMLSLNAAIEAARAGEHGKGFAVVAAQVRKLAENSQKAAGEISKLSADSVEVAERAGTLLSEIVPAIRQTADLVQEISAASREQSSGAEQVNKAILQLDSVVQQNASASEQVASTSEEQSSQAEEMAATSEELSAQARRLLEVIQFFRVGTETTAVTRDAALPSPEPHAAAEVGVTSRARASRHATDEREGADRRRAAETGRKDKNGSEPASSNGTAHARELGIAVAEEPRPNDESDSDFEEF